MSLAVVTASHSPLLHTVEPRGGARAAVGSAFAQARAFVAEFQPDLVVVLAPDHYNGMFYDLMPPFCVGTAAEAVGDYGTARGPLAVDADAARHVVREVLAADVDLAMSERMFVDHGFAQPLEQLFGSIDAVATVPVFVNAVAVPFGPVRRTRRARRGARARPARTRPPGAAARLRRALPRSPDPHAGGRAARGRRPAHRRPESDGRGAGRARGPRPPRGPRRRGRGTRPAAESGLGPRLPRPAGRGPARRHRRLDQRPDHRRGGQLRPRGPHLAGLLRGAGRRRPYAMRTRFYRPIPEWIAGFGITTAETRRTP
ncbi:hypothetical protein LUX39_51450 [Actinomadura madurae]|nr:hypothetical protein [Actinomadura madurae]MCQ0021043.1 hypothetical protein [Actinomadura madurae]